MTAAYTWLAILLGFLAGWTVCSLMAARRRAAELDAAFDEGHAHGWDAAVTHFFDAH